MNLSFTFGGASAGQHDHHDAAPSASLPSGPPSSVLQLNVSLRDGVARGAVISGDGTVYAQAEKPVPGFSHPEVASAVRSVLARAVAELPEPVQESVSEIRFDLGGPEAAVAQELGLAVDLSADPPARIDDALQARTGITAGTPILLG